MLPLVAARDPIPQPAIVNDVRRACPAPVLCRQALLGRRRFLRPRHDRAQAGHRPDTLCNTPVVPASVGASRGTARFLRPARVARSAGLRRTSYGGPGRYDAIADWHLGTG